MKKWLINCFQKMPTASAGRDTGWTGIAMQNLMAVKETRGFPTLKLTETT